MIEIRRLGADEREQIAGLAEVLVDCVEGGASVNFMAGYSRAEAAQFFGRVFDSVGRGERTLLAAFLDSVLVGTVQLVTAMPPNQPHRSEVVKLLVHRAARGRGIAGLLMERAEEAARAAGKTLLVLDTASAEAERVYVRGGWTRLGTIPDFCLLPDGRFCDTTIYFKRLS